MKKFNLILAALALFTASGAVVAQTRPGKGSFGTEVQFNPFDQNGKTFQLDGLKFRYFLTDNDALRLKVGFGFDSEKYKPDDGEDDFVKGKAADLSVDLGYERHFNVAKRLDLYVGAQIGIYKHFASAKSEWTEDNGNGQMETIETEYKNYIPGEGNDDYSDRAYFGVAASVFTGLDFYIYKGLYIGTELGLYIKSHKTNKAELKVSGMETQEMNDSERYTSCKFDIEPTLRLGWTF